MSPTLLLLLVAAGSSASAFDPSEELVFLQYDYDDVAFDQARTFNISLDGFFNNSLITVGAFILLGIILFGKWGGVVKKSASSHPPSSSSSLLQSWPSTPWTSTTTRRTASAGPTTPATDTTPRGS